MGACARPRDDFRSEIHFQGRACAPNVQGESDEQLLKGARRIPEPGLIIVCARVDVLSGGVASAISKYYWEGIFLSIFHVARRSWKK